VNMPAQVALVISSLGLGLSSLWCWYPAHQHYKLTGNPFSRHMRWLVVVLAFTQFLRIQGAFTDWTLESFGKTAISLSIWSAIYVMGILRYCFYIGMRLHESAQKQILAAMNQARMEENIKLNAQMAHLERQHSLGVMAASFSHELNQPLTAIVNYADLGKHRLSGPSPDPKELGDLMDRIIQNTMRMSQVIQRIRNFIQPATMHKEEVNLKQVVQEVIALLANEALKKNVQLFAHLDEKKLTVQADSIHLSQVFLNVIRNAMDATAHELRREVHVRLAQQNDKAMVLVQDTGPGLSAEAEKMAGTPFFTTKAQGLGMGLSISTRILSQYDGTLSLKSMPSAGTTVSIVLPLSSFKTPGA
jgi:C4-dicarboxylate-specific signal transduction histidine kinase